MIYLQLFFSFLQIGCFSFGGGYAAMPLIQEQVVTLHSWLTPDSFSNLVTIAEMTPGPIAINAATFVGTQIAGPFGALIATVGCILPSCILVTFMAFIYTKYRTLSLFQGILSYLRPVIISMIAKAGITILLSAFFISSNSTLTLDNLSLYSIFLFVIALLMIRKLNINPILTMILCGLMELFFQLITH